MQKMGQGQCLSGVIQDVTFQVPQCEFLVMF